MSARRRATWLITGLVACVWVMAATGGAFAQHNKPVSGIVRHSGFTNSAESRRSYLRSQEQFQAERLALERAREDADAVAAQNAQADTAKLAAVEGASNVPPSPGSKAVQSPNRPLYLVAGVLAGLGLLAIVLTAFLQWRAVNRLAEIIALAPRPASGAGRAPAGTGTEEMQATTAGTQRPTDARLLAILERLEQRVQKIEQSAEQPLSPSSASEQAGGGSRASELFGQAAQVERLLGQGRSLLQLDQPENTLACLNALACFEEALALDPHNVEALLKQGAALERLDRLEEAVACYDRAIALDGTLTVAYLHKAGLFNRLGRYDAALECYQQALRAQEKSRAA